CARIYDGYYLAWFAYW
nr:immunoglobulin heavy chain junction region [Mus musculus]